MGSVVEWRVLSSQDFIPRQADRGVGIASNEDVDFDIFFFDDDATLGEKIEVGEAIESALQRMGCPHALQAHQIQGLDYQALYPVVQWLVHIVSSTRHALGDQLRKYSHLRFHENYHFPDDAHLIPSHMVRLNVASQALREQLVPRGHPPLKDKIMGIRSEDIHSAVLEHSETAEVPKKQVLEFETTMSTTEGRTKFVESLDLIAKGVQQKVEKTDTKLKTKQNEITIHKEKHGKIVATRREYVALMKIFQDECAKNGKLQQALKVASA